MLEQGNRATLPRRSYGARSHALAQSHLLVSDQETVGVFVLTRNAVVGDEVGQLLDEAHHLLVPGDVGHGEVAGRAFTAVRHALGRNMETVTVSLTLRQLRAEPARQPQQTPKTGCFASPSHGILWKGIKYGDGVKTWVSPSATHHQTTLCSVVPSSKTQVSLYPAKMDDAYAPELPRDLREGHFVVKHDTPGRKSCERPTQRVSVTLLQCDTVPNIRRT